MVYEGTMREYEHVYRFNSKWVRKKEKYGNSSLSNNDIVFSQRPGLKMGMDFRGLV